MAVLALAKLIFLLSVTISHVPSAVIVHALGDVLWVPSSSPAETSLCPGRAPEPQ